MMKPQVFLSYSNRDRKVASAVGRELARLGASTFDPETDSKRGSNSREAVMEGIRDSDRMVVLWTPLAATSDWISYEVGSARALGKDIIILKPYSLSAADLPNELVGWRTVDFDPAAPGKPAQILISSLAAAD